MKISARFWGLAVAGGLAVGWGMVQSTQGCFPTCLTNWCEVVQAPSGDMWFTKVVIIPESPMCMPVAAGWAYPEVAWRCSDVTTLSIWSPPSANCPPVYGTTTNWCPAGFITNWWVVDHPGYSASGPGCVAFIDIYKPAPCGEGVVSFYGIWREIDPCTGQLYGGGTISISSNFTVINVDIAETEKTVCACDTTAFTLTNTCGGVTWEVWPDELGGPHASGSAIIAGTNCGTWQVIARSTNNPYCMDAAWLTVVTVDSIAPDGGMLMTNYPIDTYAVAYCPNNFITVTASPCPGFEEMNLPACWQMTGGLAYTNGDGTVSRIKRRVDTGSVGSTTVTTTAGCSSNSVKVIVYQAKYEIAADTGNCTTDPGHAWWNLSIQPSDIYPFLTGTDPDTGVAIDLSGFGPQGTAGYYGDGSGNCLMPWGCPGHVTYGPQPITGTTNYHTASCSYWWCVSFDCYVNALQSVYNLHKHPGTYHLTSNNCVTHAVTIGNAACAPVYFGGYSPCGLCEYLQTYYYPISVTCTCQ